jgi:hypothetical protein
MGTFMIRPNKKEQRAVRPRISGILQMTAAVVLAVAPFSVFPLSPPVWAAAGVQALVVQAERNTNSVGTLVHQDQQTRITAGGNVVYTATGSEDETRNREADSESVTVTAKTGRIKTLHYTADILFLNGKTYYRTSLTSNKWQSQSGTTFSDPYTGGWKRGRTTVPFDNQFKQLSKFQEIGSTGSRTHVRATFSDTKNAVTGSIDMWISSGAKPYVVRELLTEHPVKGTGSLKLNVVFTSFNTPLVITAPAKSGNA